MSSLFGVLHRRPTQRISDHDWISTLCCILYEKIHSGICWDLDWMSTLGLYTVEKVLSGISWDCDRKSPICCTL